MTAVISKWGNSRGVRIPKPYLEDLGLKENDIVDIEMDGNVIIIKKASMRISKSLEERFEDFYGTDFDVAIAENPYNSPLVDWGKPTGEEVW
ncbi:MAG: AbrB/MazE/SpoVT family DNA-binding domain-containing protein [Defluviitaleaceae bacterium]|nr:AbrB/MazE/SpoVT family DNA-binding domain-containing protein [Defluviitaleaceae bacterium]